MGVTKNIVQRKVVNAPTLIQSHTHKTGRYKGNIAEF